MHIANLQLPTMNQNPGFMGQSYMNGHGGAGYIPGMNNMASMTGGGIETVLMNVLTFVLPLVFWTLVIATVAFLGKGLWQIYQTKKSENATLPACFDALTIIRNRYANGDIGKEEFEQMKQVLA